MADKSPLSITGFRHIVSCSREKVRAAEKGRESRVAAEGIEEGMYFEELHDVRAFFSGALHP